MRSVRRLSSGLSILVLLTAVGVAASQSDVLDAAIRLFENQDYVAAQEALLQVDRAELTDAQRSRLDELLQIVPEAIKGAEKATQDLAHADAAYQAGEWNNADRLYTSVEANKYATPQNKRTATDQRRRIAEKKKLAEAAQPSGTIEPPPVSETRTEVRVVEEQPPADAQAAPEPAPQQAPPAEELPRPLTPTDELRMRDALLWQRAVAVSESLTARVREALANRDFTAARRDLATAIQTIESAAAYAEPISKYHAAREGLLALQREVDQAQQGFEQQQAQEEQQEIVERLKTRRELIERQRQEKIAQLFNSAEQLRKERRYAEAAEVLREILRLEPGNAEARYQLNWAEDLASYEHQARWKSDLDTQTREALVNAEEALIPWDVDVMYPSNWLELTARRARSGEVAGESIEDVELNRRLATPLPNISFEETPFDQVMGFLEELTKVNISVDWQDLEDAGIERDNPVSLRFITNVAFRTVLNEVLKQVGGETEIAYSVGDGILRIATRTKLNRDKIRMVYDIRDLLVQVPMALRQSTFDVTQGLGQVQAGGGGGAQIFSQGGGTQQQQQQQQQGPGGLPLNPIRDLLLDLIRGIVERDSWEEVGGDAALRELNGQLIVSNTADAHRQLRDLLSQLRQKQAMQISVETRFLNVISNFLEEFGVDLDFVFNSGTAGYDRAFTQNGVLTDPATGAIVLVPRDYSYIGAYPSVPPFGQPFTASPAPLQPYGQAAFVPQSGGVPPQTDRFTPIGVNQSSINLAVPAVATGVPGSFGPSIGLAPALSISGSFLDNLQVDFLIRATQANSRSSVVQAPRLVLLNGQASRITVGRSRQYVSSLEPQVAEAAVAFTPIIGDAPSGVEMFVEGTISSDRRYVTLYLIIQQREEALIEKFETQRGSGNSPSAFVSLVSQAFSRMETSVSIPDGGTVLLGGMKQSGEIEVDAGVPVLSDIPVLKRAFTNQTTVKDTRTLLVLVKTKIIIQDETEEEAFPTFTRG